MTVPKVFFSDFAFDQSCYCAYGKKWKASTLLQACKDQNLKPFKLPLAGLDLSHDPWRNWSHIDGMAYHMKRALNTDLQYPIILDHYGTVADGYHRIVKALVEEKTYIMAYRLKWMPEADATDEG